MDNPGIQYRPLPNATPETEVEVLAAVYSFLIERHEEREVAEANDAEGDEDDRDREASTPGGGVAPANLLFETSGKEPERRGGDEPPGRGVIEEG